MVLTKWLMFLPHGFVEAAVVFTVYMVCAAKWSKSWVPAVMIPLLGYSFAWCVPTILLALACRSLSL